MDTEVTALKSACKQLPSKQRAKPRITILEAELRRKSVQASRNWLLWNAWDLGE